MTQQMIQIETWLNYHRKEYKQIFYKNCVEIWRVKLDWKMRPVFVPKKFPDDKRTEKDLKFVKIVNEMPYEQFKNIYDSTR